MTRQILTILLFFTISITTVSAASGIFQTYAIVNSGIGNMYSAGGANADGAPSFNGTNYGTPATLILNGGEIKSYKNGGSNVTGAFIYYRVYKQTDPAPSFVQLNLPYDSELGNGDQKWDETAANIDVLALATAGNGDYFLEVYWQITSSDGDIFDSNFGANFKASFTINILPVELTSFSATSVDKQVRLNWETAQEFNNDLFEIERKTNNSHTWEHIGKREGKGNSDETVRYNFSDTKPATGTNYYRLKQIDFDGQYEYSEMVSVEVRNTFVVDIFPNPTASELTVIVPNGFTEGQFQLFDTMGKMLISIAINENNYLNLNELNPGIYFLRLLDVNGNIMTQNKIRKI